MSRGNWVNARLIKPKPRKAVFCDQFTFQKKDITSAKHKVSCFWRHNPRFYWSRNGNPLGSGYKRRCEDFEAIARVMPESMPRNSMRDESITEKYTQASCEDELNLEVAVRHQLKLDIDKANERLAEAERLLGIEKEFSVAIQQLLITEEKKVMAVRECERFEPDEFGQVWKFQDGDYLKAEDVLKAIGEG